MRGHPDPAVPGRAALPGAHPGRAGRAARARRGPVLPARPVLVRALPAARRPPPGAGHRVPHLDQITAVIADALRGQFHPGTVLVTGGVPARRRCHRRTAVAVLGWPGRAPPRRLGYRPRRRVRPQRRHGHPRRAMPAWRSSATTAPAPATPPASPDRQASRSTATTTPARKVKSRRRPLRGSPSRLPRSGTCAAAGRCSCSAGPSGRWPTARAAGRPGPGHDPAGCACLTCHGFHAATTSPARLAAMLARGARRAAGHPHRHRGRAGRGRHRPAQRRARSTGR